MNKDNNNSDNALTFRRTDEGIKYILLWDKFRLEPASLLGVEITHLLWDVQEGDKDLVVTLFGSLLSGAAGTANLNRQFLAFRVTHKLARLHLNVLRKEDEQLQQSRSRTICCIPT